MELDYRIRDVIITRGQTNVCILPPEGQRVDDGNGPIIHGQSFEITTKKIQFKL